MIMNETMNGVLGSVLFGGFYWTFDSRNMGILKIDITDGRGEFISLPIMYTEKDIPFFSITLYKDNIVLLPYNELVVVAYNISTNSFFAIGNRFTNEPRITACAAIGNEIWAWGLEGAVIHIIDNKGDYLVKSGNKDEMCDGFRGCEIAGKIIDDNYKSQIFLIANKQKGILRFEPTERKTVKLEIAEELYACQSAGVYNNRLLFYKYYRSESKLGLHIFNINENRDDVIMLDSKYGVGEAGGYAIYDGSLFLLPFKSGTPVCIDIEGRDIHHISGIPYLNTCNTDERINYISACAEEEYLYSFYIAEQKLVRIDMSSKEVSLHPLNISDIAATSDSIGRKHRNFMQMFFKRMNG